MAKRYRPKSTVAILTEMTSDNERTRAVVTGSFLDGVLDRAITRKLIALTPGEESALYKPGGPLGGCHQKILIGHALGLFGKKAKAQLETINEVRNIFAHNMNEVSFDDPEVADLARKVVFALSDKELSRPLKDRFVNSAHYLILGLAWDGSNADEKFKTVVRLLSE
jgi:hypothetical protein